MDQYLSTVEAATKDGLLKNSSELVEHLSMLPTTSETRPRLFDVLLGQVKLAKELELDYWLITTAQEMTVRQLHSRAWIRENVWDIGAGHTRKPDGVDWDDVPRSDASPHQPNLELPRAEEKLLDMGDDDVLDMCASDEDRLLSEPKEKEPFYPTYPMKKTSKKTNKKSKRKPKKTKSKTILPPTPEALQEHGEEPMYIEVESAEESEVRGTVAAPVQEKPIGRQESHASPTQGVRRPRIPSPIGHQEPRPSPSREIRRRRTPSPIQYPRADRSSTPEKREKFPQSRPKVREEGRVRERSSRRREDSSSSKRMSPVDQKRSRKPSRVPSRDRRSDWSPMRRRDTMSRTYYRSTPYPLEPRRARGQPTSTVSRSPEELIIARREDFSVTFSRYSSPTPDRGIDQSVTVPEPIRSPLNLNTSRSRHSNPAMTAPDRGIDQSVTVPEPIRSPLRLNTSRSRHSNQAMIAPDRGLDHSVSAREPIRQQSNTRLRRCIIPGCGNYQEEPRQHAFAHHVPTVFDERLGSEVTNRRLTALKLVSAWLFGVGSTLQEMAGIVDSIALLKPIDNEISREEDAAMRALCEEIQEPSPATFTLAPLNSPAALCHWRALMVIISQLEPRHRQMLKERFHYDLSTVESIPEDDGQDMAVQVLLPLSQQVIIFPERQIAEASTSSDDYPEAYDSHFHLDRTRKLLRPPSDATLGDISQHTDPGDYRVKLVGAVAVFCDPDTFPSPRTIQDLRQEGLRVAIGLHPKYAPAYTDRDLDAFRALHRLPEVTGLGEIGLDRTAPNGEWGVQRQILSAALSELLDDQVLVLHCRRHHRDQDDQVYRTLLNQVKREVPVHQLIHLHCFEGTRGTIEEWMAEFPRVYFGFTRLMNSFQGHQIAGLKAVSTDRILAETDSPYFADRRHAPCNTPALIGWTVQEMARLRRTSYQGDAQNNN